MQSMAHWPRVASSPRLHRHTSRLELLHNTLPPLHHIQLAHGARRARPGRRRPARHAAGVERVATPKGAQPRGGPGWHRRIEFRRCRCRLRGRRHHHTVQRRQVDGRPAAVGAPAAVCGGRSRRPLVGHPPTVGAPVHTQARATQGAGEAVVVPRRAHCAGDERVTDSAEGCAGRRRGRAWGRGRAAPRAPKTPREPPVATRGRGRLRSGRLGGQDIVRAIGGPPTADPRDGCDEADGEADAGKDGREGNEHQLAGVERGDVTHSNGDRDHAKTRGGHGGGGGKVYTDLDSGGDGTRRRLP